MKVKSFFALQKKSHRFRRRILFFFAVAFSQYNSSIFKHTYITWMVHKYLVKTHLHKIENAPSQEDTILEFFSNFRIKPWVNWMEISTTTL